MRFDFQNFAFGGQASDRPALAGTDRRLTWTELEREVDRLATQITRHRVGQGTVMIYGHKEAGVVTSILACLKLGVPYVPVDTIVPPARVARIREVAATSLVLATGPDLVADALNVRVPSGEVAGVNNAAFDWVGQDDLAYVIFTSGSTGEPKGVQITRDNVRDLATWVGSPDFGFTADTVVMNQCSFSFDVSFFDVIAALGSGGTLLLNSPAALKEPKPYDALEAEPTDWVSTPSFLSLALTAPGFEAANFPKLRRFYVAGEAVQRSLVERLWRKFPDAEFWNAYGPTEATVITTLVRVTPEMLTKYPSVPIGSVKPGVTMPTTAADGTSEGELAIIGANVSPGYLNRPDLNETRFFAEGRARGYRTGDLGYHQDGYVFYQGRIDSQVKLHGYRIELDEIDSVAGEVADVSAAATIGLRRGGEVKKLVCFIQARAGADGEAVMAEVKRELGAKLPYYMVPAEFRLIGDLPYNTNHKVDRGALARALET